MMECVRIQLMNDCDEKLFGLFDIPQIRNRCGAMTMPRWCTQHRRWNTVSAKVYAAAIGTAVAEHIGL
jgi:hypothetical protein